MYDEMKKELLNKLNPHAISKLNWNKPGLKVCKKKYDKTEDLYS